jgi:HTH-type transcriptional regulator / antitoxin HigA
MNHNRTPFISYHVGDFIQQQLDEVGWEQQDLVEVTGLSLKHLNQIINGKAFITFDIAKQFANIFGNSPQYWMNLDMDYRLFKETVEEKKQLQEIADKAEIYKKMPISEMVKRGWIPKFKNLEDLKKKVMKFWNKENQPFNLSFLTSNALPALRKGSKGYNPCFTACWFSMCKTKSKDISVAAFNKNGFEKFFQEVKMYMHSQDSIPEMLNRLNSLGVKFLVFRHLKQTYINGAAYMDGKNPVIVLTIRYDRLDHFWFTFLHELAHVLLHRDQIKEGCIDYDQPDSTDMEKEANEAAIRAYGGDGVLKYFENHSAVSDKEIRRVAKSMNVHISVVKGLLANEGKIPYNRIHRENVSVLDILEKGSWVSES